VLYEICIWLARYLEKKDRAAYPEYYAELEKDSKELDKEVKDDWDNENYNPWFSEDDREDEEDEYQKPRPTPSAPPPEVEKAPAPAEEIDTGEDQSSQVVEDEPLPETPPPAVSGEKTLEELAREDELRSGNPKE
jgi:sec-independent protein translocase protein TatC